MAGTVTLIPGDGIGPEVSRATVRMLEAAGADLVWEEKEAKPIVGLRH
jgi:isocitrate dehydrogenase (NAD+)